MALIFMLKGLFCPMTLVVFCPNHLHTLRGQSLRPLQHTLLSLPLDHPWMPHPIRYCSTSVYSVVQSLAVVLVIHLRPWCHPLSFIVAAKTTGWTTLTNLPASNPIESFSHNRGRWWQWMMSLLAHWGWFSSLIPCFPYELFHLIVAVLFIFICVGLYYFNFLHYGWTFYYYNYVLMHVFLFISLSSSNEDIAHS